MKLKTQSALQNVLGYGIKKVTVTKSLYYNNIGTVYRTDKRKLLFVKQDSRLWVTYIFFKFNLIINIIHKNHFRLVN